MFEKIQNLKLQWTRRNVFDKKTSFIATNRNKYKKRCSAIMTMLKNYLTHDLSWPSPKKLMKQIQNLKLQCTRRCILDKTEALCLLTMASTKKEIQQLQKHWQIVSNITEIFQFYDLSSTHVKTLGFFFSYSTMRAPI